MAQSEKELEDKLIKQLKEQGFKSVTIKDENDLLENLKLQIETFNRIQLTDQEFKRIVIHLEGGSIFDKAKKLRDKYELIRDDGDVIYISVTFKEIRHGVPAGNALEDTTSSGTTKAQQIFNKVQTYANQELMKLKHLFIK